jgi:isoleucyl-tRNA synthetase
MSEKDNTIHLPKTDFPMKGNLNQREPEFLKKWEEHGLYKALIDKRKAEGAPSYILHDGPPYANGNIHMGHALNKVLKDIIVRYRSFKGYYAPYVPGWDCHGMPIEHKVVEKLGSRAQTMSKLEIRQLCSEYAMRFVELQKEQFKRLGVMGDWENPYLTLAGNYEDKMVSIFWEMYKKGLVYKGLKPVYWCTKCETALAEAEVEYADHKSPSVFVRFKVRDDSESTAKMCTETYFVIWTTTPWTLPANVAIAVHPDYEYAQVKAQGTHYIVAKQLLPSFAEKTGITDYNIIKTFGGNELEHIVCEHPFIDRDSIVINATYITLDAGTGCVHIAPGHGHDDYVSSLKYNLPILNPVDGKGRFTEEFPQLQGQYVFKANPMVIEILKEKGALLGQEEITHSYPHCWRCKSPIIFRATKQWFISMDAANFRQQAIEEVKKVKWFNPWGEDRITKMIESRPDWCVSRQRAWGVPIFVFSCPDCGESIVNEFTIGRIHELIKNYGSDGWFKYSVQDILGEYKCPNCGGENLAKENDIFDVWFDSGASSFAVLEDREGLTWPADLYLEGSDQYRGWFQSSLLAAVGYKGSAPFKSVISNGWVVDGQGKAMHKSLGNVIDPLELIKKGGADVLRLWVASEDFTADQSVSEEIMSRVTDSYRRIRNTFRFMLGAIDDFKKEEAVPYDSLSVFDKYALHRLQVLLDTIEPCYANFEFYKVVKEYTNFCSTFLSSFYFDVLKDRLYTYKSDGVPRRAAQTVIHRMLIKLAKAIAPVLVFTADEVWQFLPESLREEQHIQLAVWSAEKEKMLSTQEAADWEMFIKLRDVVLKKIEEKRNEKLIKHPYEADVILKYKSSALDVLLKKFRRDEIEQMFIVSNVKLEPAAVLENGAWDDGLQAEVTRASAQKCDRCWRCVDTVGKDAEHPGLCSRCVENLG